VPGNTGRILECFAVELSGIGGAQPRGTVKKRVSRDRNGSGDGLLKKPDEESGFFRGSKLHQIRT